MNELLYLKSKDFVLLPPAFYEALTEVLKVAPDSTVEQAITEAMSLTGMAYSETAMEKTATRLNQERKERESEPPQEKSKKVKPSIGTSFLEWVNNLKLTSICYYLADFDPGKAEHFYFSCDMLMIIEAFKIKSEHATQMSKVQYESALYGFGGSYEGDSKPGGNVTEFDMSEKGASKETIRSLKALKF